MVYSGSHLDEVTGRLGPLASESIPVGNRVLGHQEDRNDESVSRRLVPPEEEMPLEKKRYASQSKDPAWHLIPRHITADQASSHVHILEPALRGGLARAAF